MFVGGVWGEGSGCQAVVGLDRSLDFTVKVILMEDSCRIDCAMLRIGGYVLKKSVSLDLALLFAILVFGLRIQRPYRHYFKQHKSQQTNFSA